jgi:hypothetical protein
MQTRFLPPLPKFIFVHGVAGGLLVQFLDKLCSATLILE